MNGIVESDADPHDTLPPPPPARRRLYRSTEDRKIAGVCGGLAEYFDIDPTLVRVGFLLGLLAGGVGVVAYVILALAVPETPHGTSPYAGRPPSIEWSTGLALVLLALAVFVGFTGPFDGGVLVPLALIGGGIYLLVQRPQGPEPPSAARPVRPGEPPIPPRAAGSPPPAPAGRTDRTDDWPVGPPAAPEAEPRPPAVVTRVVLSLAALAAAVAVAAETADWWDVTFTQTVGVVLVLVGGGLLVGAFIGGTRGLVALGLLATIVLLPLAALDSVVDDGIGTRRHTPRTLAELRREYRLGIGELVVDLGAVDLEGETRRVVVDLGIGDARVIVPSDATVVASVDVDFGEARLFGVSEEGAGNEIGPRTIEGTDGRLIVDLEVGMGEGRIVRAGS